MRWYNVNECGEVYDSFDNEADARAMNEQFPNDVVVYASSEAEAEDLAQHYLAAATWDGSFTPEQEAFDREVRENDEALFRALGLGR